MPRFLPLALVCAVVASPARAQVPADSVRLGVLRAAAEARDPRAAEPELLARASRLRLQNLRAERLPQLAFTGQATLQSGTLTLPVALPGGTPEAPRVQGRAQVEADWNLLDGGRRDRRADVERARLAESQADVAVALYSLREATTEAFFGALLYEAQASTLALSARDLAARLALLRARAREGAALGADAAAVEAELIRVRQRIAEAEADRRAALAVLADLTGLPLDTSRVLALPHLDAAVALARAEAEHDSVAGHPELRRAARAGQRAEAEARLAETALQPSLSVFGQGGVGRPSPFELLSDDVKPYALAGVRLRWAPLDYGRARRDAAAARLQADLARTQAASLARRFRRDAEDEAAALDRLDAAGPDDARAVVLREEIARVAGRQLDEGVLLAADYVDRLTDLADARLTVARHRIERARAQARLLSTLGRFPDAPSDALADPLR